MERIFIEDARASAAQRWGPIGVALCLHGLAAVAFAILWRPAPLPEPVSTPINIALVYLPPPAPEIEEPVAEEPDVPAEEPEAAQTEPSPEPAPEPRPIALPDIDLPNVPPTEGSAEVERAREALSGFLCIVDTEEEGEDCEREQLTRGVAQALAADEALEEDMALQRAIGLNLASDPNSVPPVADPARDPIAPDDFSYKNPVDSIRDPIPGVTHH